uniref:Uncharacterized protein n=1 Tax=Globodera pallida TaxID=36090 RepID=A0A183CAG7_GLOPA
MSAVRPTGAKMNLATTFLSSTDAQQKMNNLNANMYDHCEYCEGPSCNLNKIELETLYLPKSVGTKSTTRSTKGTTTTEELDNETDEPESTKRSKKIVASTKRTRRPKTSKRPSTPETPAINAAAAPHPPTMPAVLLPFCWWLFFRRVTGNV